MQYRPLGQSGINASVVGLGAWAIGGWLWGGTEEKEAVKAIHASLDAGVNFIDTAPAYGLGFSEEVVGNAIAGRRHKVVVATKCGLVWHVSKGSHFFDEYGRKVYRYLGPESVRYEVEQSLKRLGTDYIDLYQTHWQDSTTPIADTMGILLDLKAEGKIRAIGISNAGVTQMEEYRRVGPVDAAQEKYSMLDRQLEADMLPYCHGNHIAMLAYSPLALGLLTGKVGPERQFRGDDQRKTLPRFSVENRKRVIGMLELFQPVARRLDLTISQLVIAWTISQPGVTHALVGVRDPLHALENARSGQLHLSAADLSQIGNVLRLHVSSIL